MGDIIEFTTRQNHKNYFYKVTSSCINFDVRSSGPAAIGLAKEPDTNCEIWIIIGDSNGTSIKNDGNDPLIITYANILNRRRYNRFWISWAGNIVVLGESMKKQVLLKYQIKLSNLKYVTFAIVDNGPPVQWRFELPPVFKEPSIKAISKGKLKWVTGDTKLPDDAVIGGFNGEILYIIRAKHRGTLSPGAFVPSEGCGYIPWGGRSHQKTKFEVLCGLDYMWVPTKQGTIPIEAVEGGYSEINQEPLYICRAFYYGNILPGKIASSHNVCYLYNGGEEIAVKNYEILIIPNKNVQYIEKAPPQHNNVNIEFNRPLSFIHHAEYENDENDYINEDVDPY